MKISEALEMLVNEKKSEGVSRKTVSHYYQDIGYFIKLVGDIEVESIDRLTIVSYRNYLLNRVKNEGHSMKKPGGKLSKVTINSYLRTLRTMLNYLNSYDLIPVVPVKLLKEPKKVIEILNDLEIDRIMKLPEKTWLQIRNKLIIYMMLDSGLRRQEVVNLEVHQVDVVRNMILIRASKGEKDRNVPLGSATKKLFMKYMRKRPLPQYETSILFLNQDLTPLSYNSVKMFMARLKDKLEFKRFGCHFLRHTFATKYLINQYEQLGVSDIEGLKDILGHETTTTTRIYLHLANQHLYKANKFGVLDNVVKSGKLFRRSI